MKYLLVIWTNFLKILLNLILEQVPNGKALYKFLKIINLLIFTSLKSLNHK